MKKEQTDKKPPRTWHRKLVVVILFIVIAFAASDWYFNEWKTIKRVQHWNKLELKDRNDSTWQLKAHRDFQLIGIKDVRIITVTESLLVFDKPFRDSGYYRLYFRFSDTASVQLQKMYQKLLSLDTSGSLMRSVEETKRVYQNIQLLLGTTPTPSRDSSKIPARDSTKQISQANLKLGTDDEATLAIKKLFGTPQVVIGVGIGFAVSAGIDLLRGDAYCATSKNNVFRIDTIKIGARAGTWEGLPIDILWVLGKKEGQ